MSETGTATPTAAVNLAGPWPVPPTQGISNFALAMTAQEVLVVCGVSRASMHPGESGIPAPIVGVEWLMSLSLSPNAAKVLHQNLSAALKRYEELFGSIPLDPNMKVTINDVTPPSTGS